MEFTNNGKTSNLDKYLDGLKKRIPSLATKRSSTKKVVDIRKEAMIFKAFLDAQCTSGEFTVEPNKRDKINSIFAWIWKYDKWNVCNLDYNKGLYLYGPIGTGKTTILKGMQKYMLNIKARDFDKDDRIGFFLKSASELTNLYARSGQEKLLQWCDECNLLIEELGREPIPARSYGNELNVIQFLLQNRYEHRRDNITHITSNIKPEDVMAYYGDYISDRFREMFNIIHWGGTSKRK